MQCAAPGEAARLDQRRPVTLGQRAHAADGSRHQLATDHRRHQAGRGQFRRRELPDHGAVAQYRDAVGHRIDLIQEMGDEQDRHAALAQLVHHREQLAHLVLVEARGRFIEDQHASRYAQGARNGHHLLDRTDSRSVAHIQRRFSWASSTWPMRTFAWSINPQCRGGRNKFSATERLGRGSLPGRRR
jgi:hypothetical protein